MLIIFTDGTGRCLQNLFLKTTLVSATPTLLFSLGGHPPPRSNIQLRHNSPIKIVQCRVIMSYTHVNISESPDLNPIEMVWNELKRNIAKRDPRTKDDLSNCIEEFWIEHMTKEKCNTYIDHMFKAVPVCVMMDGVATGDAPNKIFNESSRGKSIAYFQEKLYSDRTVMERADSFR